ncbi:glycosyl transferase family 4 [Candidatus Woesearchaeota archaeon]|nr:glycosyl transferase family 4 [Candidatus Woesearchaeota archaeon]
MVNKLLFLTLGISFLVAHILLPFWIKRAKQAGLVGKDVHKQDHREIPEMGGICAMVGFLAGALAYIAIRTFGFHEIATNYPIMAIVATILIATLIGMVDDLLGWKIGIKQWQKPLLTIGAALPFMVANFGESTMVIPLLGEIHFGILYPLLIIPIGIVGAANGFNMIAGYNGLEAGMGIIICATLGIVALLSGSGWVAVLCLCMVFALIPLYSYNHYPAKVFSGNTLTYPLGAFIAAIAIVGNMERVAVILFIPYFIELILKLRGKFKKESFAKVKSDGTLGLRYPAFYGIEHIMVWFLGKIMRKVTERRVVYSILFIEALISIGVLLPYI